MLRSGFRFTIRLKEGWHDISATRGTLKWYKRVLIDEEKPVHTTIAFPNKDKLTTGMNSSKNNGVQVDNRRVINKSPIFVVPAVFLILIGLLFPLLSVFPDMKTNLLITTGCLILGLGYSQQKRLAIIVSMVACFFILDALGTGTKLIFLGWIQMGVVIASGLAITIGLLMERYRVLLVLLYLFSFILMVQIIDAALWPFMFTFISVLILLLIISTIVKYNENRYRGQVRKIFIYCLVINLVLLVIAFADFYLSGAYDYFVANFLIDGVISQVICAVVSSVFCISILALYELRKVRETIVN